MFKNLHLVKWALDDAPAEYTVVRGVILPDCLSILKTDTYQREQMPLGNKIIKGLIEAYRKGEPVEDIVLGMRGDRSDISGDKLILMDEIYIIDGLQRVTAAREATLKGIVPHLGAKIYFNTSHEWERDHFQILNQERIKLSPSILLRNLSETNPAVGALYRLSTQNTKFALYNKISWQQTMRKNDLLSATMYAKIAGSIHRRFGGYRSRGRVDELAEGLTQAWQRVGDRAFVSNSASYLNLVNASFDFSRIRFRNSATFLKGTFLITLALFFSANDEFWKGNYFQYDEKITTKLGSFPINDPTVNNLCSAGASSTGLLYTFLGEHFSSGRGFKLKVVAPLALTEEDSL